MKYTSNNTIDVYAFALHAPVEMFAYNCVYLILYLEKVTVLLHKVGCKQLGFVSRCVVLAKSHRLLLGACNRRQIDRRANTHTHGTPHQLCMRRITDTDPARYIWISQFAAQIGCMAALLFDFFGVERHWKVIPQTIYWLLTEQSNCITVLLQLLMITGSRLVWFTRCRIQ